MSHEVSSMFSVNETPWHGLGKVVSEAPTSAEAIKLAGLNWSVSRRKILVAESDEMLVSHEAEGFRAIVRDDNGVVFNVLRETYQPLQNAEAFKFFDPFVDAGLASFETAGALSGGRRVWILATLNKAPIDVGGGDLVRKMLLLSNGHDGSMAVRVGFTPIRVVCANTLAAAHGNTKSQLMRVAHTKFVNDRVEKIREIVNAADAKFEATAEQYRALAKADVNSEDLRKYVSVVFGTHTETDKQRRAMREERLTQDITRLFETGRGMDMKAAKGTAWGLYNAVTEYLSYEYGKTTDSRLNALWFGDSARTNERAMKEAVKLAVGA